jgi:hypothetical protein
MVDNWRLLGGVRVGLMSVDGEDSMLCLLIYVYHCLLSTVSS